MRITYLNPQGNFNSADSNRGEHPDFDDRLVDVKRGIALKIQNTGYPAHLIKYDLISNQSMGNQNQ